MTTTVVIELEDDGTVQVGVQPEIGGEQKDKSFMSPVKDVEAALQVARDMLTGQTGEQTAEAAGEAGFRKGMGPPAGMRRGMMGGM